MIEYTLKINKQTETHNFNFYYVTSIPKKLKCFFCIIIKLKLTNKSFTNNTMDFVCKLKLPLDINLVIISYMSTASADIIKDFWRKNIFEIREENPNKYKYSHPPRNADFDLWGWWSGTICVNSSIGFYGIGLPSFVNVQIDAGFCEDEIFGDGIKMTRRHWDRVSLKTLNIILNQNGIENTDTKRNAYKKLMEM